MVVLGQCRRRHSAFDRQRFQKAVVALRSRGVVLAERLCQLPVPVVHADEALAAIGDDPDFSPDLVVYLGDTVVSKRLRFFLRRTEEAKVVMVNLDGEIHDVTMHADEVVEVGALEEVFYAVADLIEDEQLAKLPQDETSRKYRTGWKSSLEKVDQAIEAYEPSFSQMAAVRYFEQQMEDMETDFHVHYANSTAIRLANSYAQHPVFCNRGVNGIDGSLSEAAGFSATVDDLVFCVTGDLSFFYDQNALWNSNLKGNLRIILLNNGKGGIFGLLPGLEQSEASRFLVSGAHHTSAQGICGQNDIGYLKASDMQEMQMGIVTLVTRQSHRPMLLEVFTDAETDAAVMRDYLRFIKDKIKE